MDHCSQAPEGLYRAQTFGFPASITTKMGNFCHLLHSVTTDLAEVQTSPKLILQPTPACQLTCLVQVREPLESSSSVWGSFSQANQ